jgi:hypothetical protein
MYVEKETEKTFLMTHNAVSFWIQKRWWKNGKLSPAGWKAFRNAEKERSEHIYFDALKEFELERETEKAVLLRCVIRRSDGQKTNIQFWMPKSMTRNWGFVARKVLELEAEFPYVNARVMWSGNAVPKAAVS